MIITVDTGGTKTLVASFDESGTIGEQIKFPTPKDTAEYTQTLRKILTDNYGDKAVEIIVLAVPGVIKNGVAIWCNNLGWTNFDIKTSLAGVLGNTPIFIENDANLAGLGETRALENAPAQSLYVTVSTGIGSGIITNGHINQALSNSEAGHAIVEFDSKAQEWENFASGRSFHDTYGQYARDITDENIWNEIADKISRGFLAVIPILQPDIVIIGGSIGTYFDYYGVQLKELLNERLPEHIARPLFVQAKYPELAVIYGCYYYAVDALDNIKAKN